MTTAWGVTTHFLLLTYHPSSNTSSGSWTAVIFGRQCHCHTSNRNLVLAFVPPPLFGSPLARQTKEVFTESNQYKMKPRLDCQLPISSLHSSPLHSDSGTSVADKLGEGLGYLKQRQLKDWPSLPAPLVNRHPKKVSANGIQVFHNHGN